MGRKYPTLKKILRKQNRVIRWSAIISLVVALTSGVMIFVLENRANPKAKAFEDVVIDNEKGEWSYLDVDFMSDCFAFYEENDDVEDRYYFVWEGSYMYIANLDSLTFYDKLADIYDYSFEDTTSQPLPVRIYGTSENISPELRQIAIEQLNEWYGENTVTDEDFDSLCGTVLLNVKRTPNQISEVPLVIGFVAMMCAWIFGLMLGCFAWMTRRTLKRIDQETLERIEGKIENGQALHLEGTGIYLTEHYVINMRYYLCLYRYEEIYWLYLYRLKKYGVTTTVSIAVGDNRKKIRRIGNAGRKYEQHMEELLVEIARRCPTALVGYTKENKKAYKERCRNGGN